jgi:hypothetical protein
MRSAAVPMSRLVREKTAVPMEKNLISQPNQPQEPYKDNQACIAEENPLLAECLLVYPVFDECNVTHHPFHFSTMRHYQQQRSDATKQLFINQPEQYALVRLGETDLICYIANPQQLRIVRYYHLTAQHAKGMDRLEWSLKRHFYHLRLRDEVRLLQTYLHLPISGKNKLANVLCGLMPNAKHTITKSVIKFSSSMRLMSDVSRMPRDRDMVIGHKVSSPEPLGSSEP